MCNDAKPDTLPTPLRCLALAVAGEVALNSKLSMNRLKLLAGAFAPVVHKLGRQPSFVYVINLEL